MTVLALPICLLLFAALGVATLHDLRKARRNEAAQTSTDGLADTGR